MSTSNDSSGFRVLEPSHIVRNEGVGTVLFKAMGTGPSPMGTVLETNRVLEGGAGLFIHESARKGDVLFKFGGKPMTRKEWTEYPDFEHCLQVGVDSFVGPSGACDDYCNHSCDPSTEYQVDSATGNGYLVALRDLQSGDELTFDYSTSMIGDFRTVIACQCGSDRCRGEVHDFSKLPVSEQKRLYAQGILPGFLKQWFEENNKIQAP